MKNPWDNDNARWSVLSNWRGDATHGSGLGSQSHSPQPFNIEDIIMLSILSHHSKKKQNIIYRWRPARMRRATNPKPPNLFLQVAIPPTGVAMPPTGVAMPPAKIGQQKLQWKSACLGAGLLELQYHQLASVSNKKNWPHLWRKSNFESTQPLSVNQPKKKQGFFQPSNVWTPPATGVPMPPIGVPTPGVPIPGVPVPVPVTWPGKMATIIGGPRCGVSNTWKNEETI